MIKTLRNTTLYLALIAFAFLGTPLVVLGEEDVSNQDDLRERLEQLREDVEELVEIVEEREKEEVSTTKEGYYLQSYIKFGAENDPQEVEKLQEFLNEYEGEDLPVTGFYGEMTVRAVKDLQEKYADEILTPWGIEESTGFVYKTTQKFINETVNPDLEVEINELVPATSADISGEVAGEEVEQQVETEEGEIREVVDEENGEAVDEENGEETEEDEDLIEDWDEETEENNVALIAIIIGAIGLAIIVYNLITFNRGTNQKV